MVRTSLIILSEQELVVNHHNQMLLSKLVDISKRRTSSVKTAGGSEIGSTFRGRKFTSETSSILPTVRDSSTLIPSLQISKTGFLNNVPISLNISIRKKES